MAATLTEVILSARDTGTPLLAVTTTDQQAALNAIATATNGAPKVCWDAIKGCTALNKAGVAALAKESNNDPSQLQQLTQNPQTALEVASRLPENAIFFMLNAHRFVNDPIVSTGILNLREPFKGNGRTAILLGPDFDLPAELKQDVVVADDPLPNDDQLTTMIRTLLEANSCPFDETALREAVEATRGLSLFAAESVTAMSMRKDGLDRMALWERKQAQVRQTKGLKLLLDGPRFTDTGGNARLLADLTDIMNGDDSPIAIVWWDEMEKSLGIEGGDLSNVTSDFKGTFLSWMEESGHDGIILVGGAGTGKSLAAKSVGPQFGKPTFVLDPGAMKGRFVGDSETAHRLAFKTINATAQGRVFVIATCNKLADVSPEIRRRFLSGIYYVDLPNDEERAAIWQLQLKAHSLIADTPDLIALSAGWTGAEIRNCCRIAKRQHKTLADAAKKIVPVSVANPESIDQLRKLANGRFHSANHPGTYETPDSYAAQVRRVSN